MNEYFLEYFDKATNTMNRIQEKTKDIQIITETILDSLLKGGTVYWFGNGGSASDAEHLAAELGGKYRIERKPLRSFALTSNSSLITAIANDFGFDQIFSRQIEACAMPGDVVIGISTSGKSRNVVLGLERGREMGAKTIALIGEAEGVGNIAECVLRIPSNVTSHIQECHIAVGQAICGYIENEMYSRGLI